VASSSPDRLRAARLLIRVEDGAFASRLLDRESLPGVRARVLGVLRWQRTLDEDLSPLSKRPLSRLDPEVRTVLRMGVFEVSHLGVPAAVATDEMIRLTRRLGKGSATGLVNAVLRRAGEGVRDQLDATPDVRWSHPEWVWRRWRSSFGEDDAVKAMAAAQEPARPWVWFPDDVVRQELVDSGVALEPHPWCPDAWTADEGRPLLMRSVSKGRCVVQDPSSQLVARTAAGVAKEAGRVADLCAAPGGKTLLLERLGEWDLLVAADLGFAKSVRLKRRLGGDRVVAADAAQPALARSAWELVLLDAPCSGSGTFRRHPELKWRLKPEAIIDAARRQRRMIGASISLLDTDGVLVYGTCSVESEENEAHFETVPNCLERVDLTGHLPEGLPWHETDAGGIRILPHSHGDGFTIHALRRRDG
jgi:16S rRNA (cytosine967-C5)-methyltransferase